MTTDQKTYDYAEAMLATKPQRPERVKNLCGKRFGRLVVRRFVGIYMRSAHWECICDCGAEKIVCGSKLINGSIKSCSCYQRDASKTHGLSQTATYRVWIDMLSRCSHRDNPRYERYAGRGIFVCDRWMNFENFIADMGEKPNGMSLDRINNDANYEPSNCRWATNKQQSRNMRRNRFLTLDGLTLCVSEWSERLGISNKTILARLRSGLDEVAALTTPVKARM